MKIQHQIKTNGLNWEGIFQTSSADISEQFLLKPFHAPQYCEIADNSFLLFPLIHERSPLSWANPIDRKVKPIENLSDASIDKLGKHSYARLREFQDSYEDGWDFGGGKALSEYSIALLDLFLNKINSFPTDPSIFLTTEGYLQLVWEDKYDQEIVIEFSHTSFVYYIECLNEEGEIQVEAIETLIQKVN